MDVVSAVSGYISKMVSAGDGTTTSSSSKMKILLLDSETVRIWDIEFCMAEELIVAQVSIVSTAITQSALLNHEVYLIEYAITASFWKNCH